MMNTTMKNPVTIEAVKPPIYTLDGISEGAEVFLKTKTGSNNRIFVYGDEGCEKTLGFVNEAKSEDGAVTNMEVMKAIDAGAIFTLTQVSGNRLFITFEMPKTTQKKANHKSNTAQLGVLPEELAAKKEEILAKGFMTEEEVDDRLDFMLNGSFLRKYENYVRIPFPSDLIMKVMDLWQPLAVGDISANPTRRFVDRYSKVAEFKDISVTEKCVTAMVAGGAVLLEGDKSVGKTVMAETLAWLRYSPICKTVFDQKMTSSDIYGSKTTKPTPVSRWSDEEAEKVTLLKTRLANGKITYNELTEEQEASLAKWDAAVARSQSPEIAVDETQLMRAYRNGYVALADEFNHAPAQTTAALNGFTDDSPFVATAALGVVYKKRGFFLVGTQNCGAQYSATNKLDAATASRVNVIKFPYHTDILDILHEGVDEDTKSLPETFFKKANKAYMDLVTLKEQGQISDNVLNVRGFIRALNLLYASLAGGVPRISLSSAIKSCVVDAVEKDESKLMLINLALENAVGK